MWQLAALSKSFIILYSLLYLVLDLAILIFSIYLLTHYGLSWLFTVNNYPTSHDDDDDDNEVDDDSDHNQCLVQHLPRPMSHRHDSPSMRTYGDSQFITPSTASDGRSRWPP